MKRTSRIAAATLLAGLAGLLWWSTGERAGPVHPAGASAALPGPVTTLAPEPLAGAAGEGDAPLARPRAGPERTAPVAPGPASAATAVVVEVRRAEDDTPVAGVQLTLQVEDRDALGGSSGEGRTDAQGEASFVLEHGTRIRGVLVRAGEDTVRAYLGTNRAVATGSEERLGVRVSSGASVSGVVVDEQRRPVAGARVRGWCGRLDVGLEAQPRPDREVVADGSGRFRIEHLGDELVLDAAAPGMVALIRLHGALPAGMRVQRAELVLGRAGRIEGRVLDPAGRPLAGAEITALAGWRPESPDTGGGPAASGLSRSGPWPVRAVSGADGTFVLADLAERRHTLDARAAGCDPWSGSHSPLDGFLEIHLQRGLELTGRIQGADGGPLSRASVRIGGKARASTETDATGTYRLAGLVRDPAAVLSVRAEEHAILVHQPVAIRADAPNVLDLRLEAERPIAGRVIDVAGRGVANALVSVEGDRVVDTGGMLVTPTPTWERRWQLNETRTDPEGRFRLPGLYDGEFELDVRHPDDPDLHVTETLRSGVEEVVVVLDPEAVREVRLVGLVLDASSGAPVTDFELRPWSVRPHWKPGPPHSVRSDDGTYALGGLAPSSFTITFTAAGYARVQVPEREYTAGEHRVDVELYPARALHLRVVDPRGEPFAGATVWVRRDGDYLVFDAADEPYATSSSRLDARGEARLDGLPAARITLEVGGVLASDVASFDLDLTVQPEGVQQLVLEATRPAYLRITLFGAEPDAVVGEALEITGPETLRKLAEGRADVWPLEAPSFELEVRDAAGEVCAHGSGELDGAGGWSLRWTRGNSTVAGTLLGPPALELAVPNARLELQASAPHHQTLRLHLEPGDLVPAGGSPRSWALFLSRSD